jgi:4-amino-4-deoxy-L-arabinose transferase-like glycosyltransferase
MSAMKQKLLEIIEHRHFVAACVLAGLALRLLWIAFVHPPQVSDFKWYYDRALSIAAGNGYSVDGVPTAYWPVGYAGFLGLILHIFGPLAIAGQIANVFLSIATILLSYRVSRQIFDSEVAARTTIFILCFHPNQVAFNSLLCTEVWFTFLLMLGAFLFISARGRAGLVTLSGISWGLAALTKPQFIFLPAIFMLVFYINKKVLLKSAAIVYVMIFLCLLPWMMRNNRVFGKPLLANNGGIVLMQGNNPYATGTFVWNEQIRALLGLALSDGDLGHGADEVARDEKARSVAKDYILHNPLRTVALWPKKFTYLYRSDIDGFFYSMGMMQVPERSFQLLYVGLRVFAQLYYFVIFLLALISMKIIFTTRRWQYKMGLFVTLYFTAIAIAFFALARYHYPSMPWIAMYAGVGAALILGAWPRTNELSGAVRSS